MSNDPIPPAFSTPLTGPGSQSNGPDGGEMDYMEMPREMATFDRPIAPEPEDTLGMKAGKAKLYEVLACLRKYKVGGKPGLVEINELSELDLGLVNQILGEGEVSIVCGNHMQAQEAVMAGIWRVLHFGEDGKLLRDTIEIADYPQSVRDAVFNGSRKKVRPIDAMLPPGVFNAPSLVSELHDKQQSYRPGDDVHSINLTLLPQTEEDLIYLADRLGKGSTVILSRGYGNCRVSSTDTENVWWVQYYNSQESMILNSIEIINVPEVVCAAQEDVDDSAERLKEIMEVYE